MIVGIDCYHDTSAGKRSIGALVASLNQKMTRLVSLRSTPGSLHLNIGVFPQAWFLFKRWFSRCVLQHRGQEIMDGLKSPFIGNACFLNLWKPESVTVSSVVNATWGLFFFVAALKEYLKCNSCLPSRIIVYRDGVGDGQLHSVASFEVQQILDSIKALGQDYTWVGFGFFFCVCFDDQWATPWRLSFAPVPRPKLTVVVVKKRISSRFFTLFGGKTSNPPPGTVIDTEVTRPEWWVTDTSVFREGFSAAGITCDVVYFYRYLPTDLWNPANFCHLLPGMISTSWARLFAVEASLQLTTTSSMTPVVWSLITCRDWPTSCATCTTTGRCVCVCVWAPVCQYLSVVACLTVMHILAVGDYQSARPLPVCPQTGFPCWPEHPQGAQRAAGQPPLLSLRMTG